MFVAAEERTFWRLADWLGSLCWRRLRRDQTTLQCAGSVEPVSAFDDLVPVGWVRDSVQIESNLLELILEGLD